jgi:uncharacterized membrane-anchored protein
MQYMMYMYMYRYATSTHPTSCQLCCVKLPYYVRWQVVYTSTGLVPHNISANQEVCIQLLCLFYSMTA